MCCCDTWCKLQHRIGRECERKLCNTKYQMTVKANWTFYKNIIITFSTAGINHTFLFIVNIFCLMHFCLCYREILSAVKMDGGEEAEELWLNSSVSVTSSMFTGSSLYGHSRTIQSGECIYSVTSMRLSIAKGSFLHMCTESMVFLFYSLKILTQ